MTIPPTNEIVMITLRTNVFPNFMAYPAPNQAPVIEAKPIGRAYSKRSDPKEKCVAVAIIFQKAASTVIIPTVFNSSDPIKEKNSAAIKNPFPDPNVPS